MAAKRARKKTQVRRRKPQDDSLRTEDVITPFNRFFHDGLGPSFTLHGQSYRFWMLALLVISEVVTLCLTWSLWETRSSPVNLPLIQLPLPFGILLLASLILTLTKPRIGAVAHAIVFCLACVDDQYRLQPQIICFAVLILATVFDWWMWFNRWFLAAMWTWTGIHKLVSPEWLGSGSWTYLQNSGITEPERWHFLFAITVATFEIALGIITIVAPRRAAYGCVALHLGVLISLSPLFRNHNESVWPWNLALAVVGFWILNRKESKTESASTHRSMSKFQIATLAVLWIMPVGFYFDLVNPHAAFVLFSGNEPTAYHTSSQTVKRLDGYNGKTYPFPNSIRLFIQTFELTGEPGDKLFIDEPRWGMSDHYYLLDASKTANKIHRERFYEQSEEEVQGIEIPNFQTAWTLLQHGVKLESRGDVQYYSAQLDGTTSTTLFNHLFRLHNLRELKIANATISPAATANSNQLKHLEILQLEQCNLPLDSWQNLTNGPAIRWIQTSHTTTSPAVVQYLSTLQDLNVLRLVDCDFDNSCSQQIKNLPNLSWLDLKGTKITSAGVNSLGNLPQLNWLDLSDTEVDDRAISALQRFPNLKILTLSQSRITDGAFNDISRLNLEQLDIANTATSDAAIESLLPQRELLELDIRGTRISKRGLSRLQSALPAKCQIRFDKEE
jgi:hypothetical protein